MKMHRVRCFGATPASGNLALVIEDGPAGVAERQAIATGQGAPACVFIDGAGPWEADFYYPHARSPLCLHATLAAAHVLCQRHGGPVTIKTAMRDQMLELTRELDGTFARVRKQAVAPIGIEPGLPAHLLGTPGLVPASPALLSSVGSPKLLIEVENREALQALAPPLQRIVDWGKEHGINGCYAYCQVGENEYEGRNFNHRDPAREDAATGVAAGALCAWLGRDIVVYQGANLGNPCTIRTRIDGQAILIGGLTIQEPRSAPPESTP